MRTFRMVRIALWIALFSEAAAVPIAMVIGLNVGKFGVVGIRVLFATIIALCFAGAANMILTGEVPLKGGGVWTRGNNPIGYWLVVSFVCAAAIGGLFVAFSPSSRLVAADTKAKPPTTAHSAMSSPKPPVSTSAPARDLTQDQAIDLIWRLPEVRAWDAYIRKTTHNKVHGSVMVDGDPQRTDGRGCWRILFGENGPEAWHPWETFEVDVRTGDVFVEDPVESNLLPLEKWRNQTHPMDRIK